MSDILAGHFFRNRYDKHGRSVKSLGWGSRESQRSRFGVLLREDIVSMGSLLDVGCGFADLNEYLSESGACLEYAGVEKEEAFLSVCQSRYPESDMYSTIWDVEKSYDLVYASGIFCFETDGWEESTALVLKKLFDISKIAVVVNFLYSQAPRDENEEMHFTNLKEIGNILEQFPDTALYNIYHDYKSNDITLSIYKKKNSE